MLSVKSVRDELVVWVKNVKDPVSVVLRCCSENHNLKDLRHVFQEGNAVRSDLELSLFGFKVN